VQSRQGQRNQEHLGGQVLLLSVMGVWFLGGIDNLSTVIYNSCVLQLLVSVGGRELVGAGVRR